ncbi:response regulator [Mesorhizobium sp. BAC0120]|uniref:response regulator n=1 Tax=Mesorhizobium sp. BAC0120 TaxID=3090670 RepID=UPI00298BFC14|nr:response regulator [Mesorhizobium sp. BAC0120]MDW6022364.1 response regulator [Mesorhizobium sp. BAC0120]
MMEIQVEQAEQSLIDRAAGARVLAVDDDERNLLAIAEVLDGIGDVVCVSSGEEALRCLLKDEFAVILLDVLMPGLDGYETAALIRKRERSKNTPIIFLTAINKEEAHMLRGYDAGAVDYVFKPFDPVMLHSKVTVFVDLYEKKQEIERKAAREQRLLEQALKAQSEKLEAERALRDSEARQQAMLSSLPVSFHARSVDPPFAARYVSRGVERLTGFAPPRFVSDPDFGLSRVHPEDLDTVKEALIAARHTGSYACEFRWLCADGQYRIFLDKGIVSEDGAGPEILGTMLDITEQRRLEDQLLQAQRLDAIGKLTGGLAHDFNNLLATILSGLNLIERYSTLDEKAARILEMTRRSAKQGTDLVDRMLAFSRRQNLKPLPVELSAIWDSMNGLVAPVLGGLIRLEWDVDQDVWPVHVDPSQLELALMNLVFNARDAMPSGGTITLRAENRDVPHATEDLTPGDYVILSVEDTGTGIPADMIAKVVEPFFTTKPAGKGTGLGLSTVYGFAKQSGGTLRIDSEVGRGTTMELWLPRSRQSPSKPGKKENTADRGLIEEADMRLPTVLLVDDSAPLRELTAMSLRHFGFEVTVAAGGAEALAAIENEPDRFDVIVTDFAMPLVSGIDVIRFARNLRAGWPAVIVTGYADAEKIVDRPADVPLINKPFNDKDLVESIRLAVARQNRPADKNSPRQH